MAIDENDTRETEATLIEPSTADESNYKFDKAVILDMLSKAGLDIPKFIIYSLIQSS